MYILTGIALTLVLIISFLGWGRLVSLAIFGRMKGDAPLHAAWGVCLVVIMGGVLNATGQVSALANGLIILAGAVLAFLRADFAQLFARVRRFVQASPVGALAAGCLALIALGTIVLSLFPTIWEPQDDAVAYAIFPRKMIETGSLNEPFSFRRLVAFGGYPFLQSLTYPFLSYRALHLMDRGIITVLTAAALAFYTRRRLAAPWPLACGAGMAFLVFPLLRINLSPSSIFSLLTLALLETVQLTHDSSIPRAKRALLLALLAAGLLTMRANALAIVGSLLVFLILAERSPGRWRDTLLYRGALLLQIGMVSGLLLLPWAWALNQSSGTPFFPLINGNFNRAVPMSSPQTLSSLSHLLWRSISFSRLDVLLLLTLSGAALGAVPVAVSCFSAAALITACAMVAAFTLADAQALHRYYSPFTQVALILVLAAWCVYLLRKMSTSRLLAPARRWAVAPRPSAPRPAGFWIKRAVAMLLIFPVVGAGLLVGTGKIDWKRQRDWRTVSLERSLQSRVSFQFQAALAEEEAYQAALATIPKGARVLAQVDAPFLLDFRDHEIFTIDDIGVVSPPPGLPIGGDPQALVDYLATHAIEYLLFVKANQPWHAAMVGGYNAGWWQGAAPYNDPNGRLRAPNYAWFFAATDQLSTRYEKLYEANNAVVLHLKRRE